MSGPWAFRLRRVATFTLSALLCAICAGEAFATLPAMRLVSAPLVSPAAAEAFLATRRAALSALPLGTLDAGAALTLGAETASTPEIADLARALAYDPDLIHEYVRNSIRYEPIYGCVKGAAGTLLDASGNDMDQAALMVALLRESGYTATFVHGAITLTAAKLASWLGVPPTVHAVGQVLGQAGIPATLAWDAGDNLIDAEVSHVWVKVVIGGTAYVFDPAVKDHTAIAGVNLAAALGFDAADFLASALGGSTGGASSIANVNREALREKLTQYAGNLADYVKTQNPGATLEDIVGGRAIAPVSGPLRQTSLPYQTSVAGEWTDLPDEVKHTLRIQFMGIDKTYASCDLAGKRLSMCWKSIYPNGGGTGAEPQGTICDLAYARLRLDGAEVALGAAIAGRGHVQPITLAIDHPYAASGGAYADETHTFPLKLGSVNAIVAGFGDVGRGLVEHHRRRLKAAQLQGLDDESEPVKGEAEHLTAALWLAENTRANRIADRLAASVTIRHHDMGLCGQDTYYCPIPGHENFTGFSPFLDMTGMRSLVSTTDDAALRSAAFFRLAGHGSALEGGVIEQSQDIPGISTVRLFDIANTAGNTVHEATSATFATIQPLLVNYSASTLASVQAYLDAGWRVLLPDHGDLALNDWSGAGFCAVTTAGDFIAHIIAGGQKGGSGTRPAPIVSKAAVTSHEKGREPAEHAQSDEPVDLATGAYLHEKTDIAVGSRWFPFGLSLKRSYSSDARLEDGPLGPGWTHGMVVTAIAGSDGFQGLGEDSPVEAASAIAEVFATLETLKAGRTLSRIVVSTLAHQWFMEQLIGNVVTVSLPGRTGAFTRLADGTWHAPPASADTLTTETDGTFRLRTKAGAHLAFDAEGRVATWADAAANTATFAYAGGFLESVSNGLGRSLSFTYTGGRLTGVSDGTGRSAAYAYDGAGNLVSVTDPAGNITTYAYGAPGLLTGVFLPSHPEAAFVTNTYDAQGRVATQTDAAGHTWTYLVAGNRTEERTPVGASRVLVFDSQGRTILERDPLGRETTLARDGEGRVTRLTFPEGNSAEYEYDANHNTVKTTLNPKPGSPLAAIVSSAVYSAAWNKPVTRADPLGRTESLTYSAATGRLTRITQPAVGGASPIISFTYNSRGQPVTITDPAGTTTRCAYFGTGDLALFTLDDGGGAFTTTLAYDTRGNVVKRTDPLGQATTFAYDALNRLTMRQGPAPLDFATQITRDADGRLAAVSRETRNPAAPWETTTLLYGATGAREALFLPGGGVIRYDYDAAGRPLRMTDPEGRETLYTFDAAGRLTRVSDGSGATLFEQTWSENGQRLSLTDSRAHTTHFTYDGFDRLARVTHTDGTYEQYAYDRVGNLVSARNRAGATITYAYDALNRLVTKTLPGGVTTTIAWDAAGRLLSATDPSGTLAFVPTSLGGVASEAAGGRTVSHLYDAAGNRVRTTWPDGYYVTYAYDALSRLASVKENGLTTLASFTHDALSRPKSLALGNGSSTGFTYYPGGLPASVNHHFVGANAGFSYEWNAAGQPVALTVTDDRYLYPPASGESVFYTVNALDQYTKVGDATRDHDAAGNLTRDGSLHYAYTPEGRLATSTGGTHSASFGYDALGRRATKAVDGGTAVTTLFDGERPIADYSAAGTLLRRYILHPQTGLPLVMATPTAKHFFHHDALGSTVALSGPTGAVEERYAYTPFGEPKSAGALGNPWLFGRGRYDAETGFVHLRARDYDPRTGRFIQPDPIGLAGGVNLYEYAGGSPQSRVDPGGLLPAEVQEGLNDVKLMNLGEPRLWITYVPNREDCVEAAQDRIDDIAFALETHTEEGYWSIGVATKFEGPHTFNIITYRSNDGKFERSWAVDNYVTPVVFPVQVTNFSTQNVLGNKGQLVKNPNPWVTGELLYGPNFVLRKDLPSKRVGQDLRGGPIPVLMPKVTPQKIDANWLP